MSTLHIANLSVGFGARTLFSQLDLRVSDQHVTAVVGANGSGKSSLMRAIVGEILPEEGTITRSPAQASIGWLPQEIPDPTQTLIDHVRGRTGVAQADAALQAASDSLAAGGSGAEAQYSAALEKWLRLGAADHDERVLEVAGQVGLDVDPHRPLGTLSGGEAARANLIAILVSQFDILLIDEPTNNLDLRGLALVEEFVRNHHGPVLVASHDRAFLDAVATDVVELNLAQQRIGHYTGGWSDYVEARELEHEQAVEAFERYAEKRDGLIAQANRREQWATQGRTGDKATKNPDKHQREKFRARADRQAARAATSKAAASRLSEVAQPRKEWQLRYRIAEGPPSAEVVASLTDAEISRGSFTLTGVTLSLERGDRVAVAGENGVGKSTLIQALFGQIELAAGRQHTGTRVRLGWLDQERSLLSAPTTVLEVIQAELLAAGVEEERASTGAIRTLLAKFGLGSEHIDRPSQTLSLGERTRALMALFQAREINTLVLDEPTNHLDIRAIEQLEAAGAGFDGTLVVVSHDRRFLGEIGVRQTWAVGGGGVQAE